MKQSLFESRHQAEWQQLDALLAQLERGQAKPEDCTTFAHRYRRLCQHLALAQERGYSSFLVDPLQRLALRGHQQLYRQRSPVGAKALDFIFAGFPQLVREQWRFVLASGLVFFGSLLIIGLLVFLVPELIYSVISPQQVTEMQGLYDPQASRLGRMADRGSGEDWMMFGYYIMNNIGIAFQTFAGGLLLGLGSLFFLFVNGMTIGAIAGHLTQIGYGATFWSFIVGHSALELSAIVLSGAAGLKMGWALIAPGRLSRGEALLNASRKSVQIVCGVIVLLLIAAFIEAYWSSLTWPPTWAKYLAGGLCWLLLATYLIFAGRNRHAPE